MALAAFIGFTEYLSGSTSFLRMVVPTRTVSVSLLAALPQSPQLSAVEQQSVLAAFQERILTEGEVLVEARTVCEELFFVQEGVLRIAVRDTQGKERTHFFREAGQFCTLLTSFEQQLPATQSLLAACPARVLAITYAQLVALSQQVPRLSELLGQLIQQELLGKLHLHRTFMGHDAARRYQLFLLHQPEVARCVPQHLIASYLGITPQSLSRLRKQID
ncbi:Crp/Fnr family transcriptional regulator [Hymenobacter sp. GOD-10R]|uniref:Crp/Fnr family transcriptional regulator n=1 Tax=Hymenobacter sp. GOD-10R TaxID=3093922 RepID=UPI002D783AC4|nr:Crp/Fnr family transcriptional regulator [Hymenobacter sp. GOD-10R]WRQ27066.1 Crp/Fnr family transcriptional regulator [Hymenobacter sp. GOD-10R]